MPRLSAALGVLLLIACSPLALAHNYKMGVLDIEHLGDYRYRVVHQFSGMDDGPQLIRPSACEQTTVERQAPLTQGTRIRTTWQCDKVLEALALDVTPRPGADLQYYLSWRSPSIETDSLPIRQWPVVANALGEAELEAREARYLQMGVLHILGGWDHLIFVLGLLVLVANKRRLIGVITAFTVGHSITLSLAVLELVRVSSAYVECLIALSIVFLIAEALRPRPDSLIRRFPASVAAFFGLFHGLGFASALREVGVPDAGRGWAIFQFNLGVEIGQLMFVGGALLLGSAVMKLRIHIAGHAAIRSLLSLAGVVAGYWTVERFISLV